MQKQITKPAYIYTFLLIILPIMDSLNGLLNGGANENGLSLGILYRVIILLFSIFYCVIYGIDKRSFLFLLILGIYLIISVTLYANYYMSTYVVVLFKLVLPIMIITTMITLKRRYRVNKKIIKKIMDVWLIVFPLTMLGAYILGIGFSTYGDSSSMVGGESVGFKGLYYAQNDISYVLDLLYTYAVSKIVNRASLINIIEFILILVSSVIMGLKGNYLIIFAVTLYYLIKAEKSDHSRYRKLVLFSAIILGVLISSYLFRDDFMKIINRWQYFYNKNSLISFVTSTRSDRVVPTFNWIKNNFGYSGIIFGSGYSYTDSIVPFKYVEMDFFDVLFQLGVLGIFLIYGYYIKIYTTYKVHGNYYSVAFILTLIISTLSGHVLETALSGVFFAVICTGLIFNSETVKES